MITKAELEAALRQELPGVDFDAGRPLTEAGLFSLNLLMTVTMIYGRWRISIPPTEFKAANFASVDSIFALAKRYEGGK